MKRRVAVTGIGIVCASGLGRDAVWSSVSAGICSLHKLKNINTNGLSFNIGGEIDDDLKSYITKSFWHASERFSRLALVAALEATEAFRGPKEKDLLEDAAVIIGTSVCGQSTMNEAYKQTYASNGRPHLNPMTIPLSVGSAAASVVSTGLTTHGPTFSVSSACASGAHAIGTAFRMVQTGEVNLAVCGGTEAPFGRVFLDSWNALDITDRDTCRPFSVGRKGTVLAEGAAILVLEPLEDAKFRKRFIYGEIVGFGMSSDAVPGIMLSWEGAGVAMRNALGDAGLRPEQIGYINAHGTGTILGDAAETKAIKGVFGPPFIPPISSTKSMHGHTLGASGAIEAAITIMALKTGILPPTVNFIGPDPDCDLNYIPDFSVQKQAEYALSNSFGFGGLNAVLAFRRA